MTYTVGYMIGSLSAASINRILARALSGSRLRSGTWLRSRSRTCRSIAATLMTTRRSSRAEGDDRQGGLGAVCHPGVQP